MQSGVDRPGIGRHKPITALAAMSPAPARPFTVSGTALQAPEQVLHADHVAVMARGGGAGIGQLLAVLSTAHSLGPRTRV